MLVLILVPLVILLITLALGGITSKRIKITVAQETQPVIKIRICLEGNEVDAIATIDTGCTSTTFFKSLIDKCQRPVSIITANSVTSYGSYGSGKTWGTLEQEVLFRFPGNIECVHYDINALRINLRDPQDLQEQGYIPTDMLLGFDFLMANKIAVDIPNQELVFLKYTTFSLEILRRRIKTQLELVHLLLKSQRERAHLLLKRYLSRHKRRKAIPSEELDTEEVEYTEYIPSSEGKLIEYSDPDDRKES